MLDIHGYDARGGNAKVYASLEGAKAGAPHVKEWDEDGDGAWTEAGASGTQDIAVIEVQHVKP